MPRKPPFYGWTLLAVVFSPDFVDVGFPVYGGAAIKSAGRSRDGARMSG
jgi:hypothetical protein